MSTTQAKLGHYTTDMVEDSTSNNSEDYSEDSDKPHYAMIEDWELGVLWLKEADRLGNEEAAAESVKTKFFDQICSETRDTRFFMGTVFPWNTWVVLGVFWPPRKYQPPLFDT